MRQFLEQKRLKYLLDKHKSHNSYLDKLDISVGFNSHEITVKGMKKFGNKVLFCTGNRAMRNYGFLDKYINLLNKHQFSVAHFDNISSNPTLKQMEEGIKVAEGFKPDFIFALGGGSVIDTAKAISVGLYGDVWDFVENKSEIKKAVPIVASATTSGTGSHVTPYAVITNTNTLEKKTLKHDLLLPKKSIVDLEIVRGMPNYIVATTGFDVLCHAAEVYTRNDCTATAEDFCLQSLELVREHLINSYNNVSLKSKLGMVYADIYAGIALALIGTHVPHAISHPISARFSLINHGQALAYVFPETSKKQIEKENMSVNKKFKMLSKTFGRTSKFVKTINKYSKALHLNNTYSFTPKDCELIYLDSIGYRKKSIDRSPVELEDEDIKEIINESLLKSN